MSLGHARIPTTNPPYTLNIKYLGNGNTIHSASNLSSPEIDIPDSVINGLTDGIIATLTDSIGNTATLRRSLVDIQLLKKQHNCLTVSNPSVDDALAAMSTAISNGYTCIASIPNLDSFGIHNDTDMDNWASGATGVFNPFVDPPGGVYARPWDRVMRESAKSGSDATNRVSVRTMLCMTFQNNYLNTSGRTRFIGVSDTNLKPDGNPWTIPSGGDYASGSYGSSVFLDWGDRFSIGFVKYYSACINAGLILSIGYTTSNSGEAEFETYSRGYTPNINHTGDFHPQNITAFKTKYNAYSGLDNNAINSAEENSNPIELARRWRHFQGEQLRKAEWRWNDNIVANVPALNRYLWSSVDSGSFLDALSPRRRTANFYKRVHPTTMLVKCNDNPGDHGWHLLIADVLTSMARRYGCIPMMEPSPPGFDFGSGENIDMVLTMKDNGVSISIFGNSPIGPYTSAGVFNRSTPAYKNEYTGNQLVRLNYPLSSVLNTNSSSGLRTAYESLKATKGVSRLDIVIVDDIV